MQNVVLYATGKRLSRRKTIEIEELSDEEILYSKF
jgi:hypothetical protein